MVVSSAAAEVTRRLPRGWGHLFLQVAIWMGFYVVYQIARGAADRNLASAYRHGEWVVLHEKHFGALFEPALQRVTDTSSVLIALTSYTYWLSQFAVVGLALAWIYFRHHERFTGFRNWIICANLIGLVGYVLVPTAPPRFFTSIGFSDTLGQLGGLNHGSGLVQLAANPYAAMPSLHAADALIVGIVLASVTRHWAIRIVWLLWPVWVWFAVMATGNHFWLDVFAGIVLGTIALLIVYRAQVRSFIAR
jgi:membrane-associated phospholipid phosphatase